MGEHTTSDGGQGHAASSDLSKTVLVESESDFFTAETSVSDSFDETAGTTRKEESGPSLEESSVSVAKKFLTSLWNIDFPKCFGQLQSKSFFCDDELWQQCAEPMTSEDSSKNCTSLSEPVLKLNIQEKHRKYRTTQANHTEADRDFLEIPRFVECIKSVQECCPLTEGEDKTKVFKRSYSAVPRKRNHKDNRFVEGVKMQPLIFESKRETKETHNPTKSRARNRNIIPQNSEKSSPEASITYNRNRVNSSSLSEYLNKSPIHKSADTGPESFRNRPCTSSLDLPKPRFSSFQNVKDCCKSPENNTQSVRQTKDNKNCNPRAHSPSETSCLNGRPKRFFPVKSRSRRLYARAASPRRSTTSGTSCQDPQDNQASGLGNNKKRHSQSLWLSCTGARSIQSEKKQKQSLLRRSHSAGPHPSHSKEIPKQQRSMPHFGQSQTIKNKQRKDLIEITTKQTKSRKSNLVSSSVSSKDGTQPFNAYRQSLTKQRTGLSSDDGKIMLSQKMSPARSKKQSLALKLRGMYPDSSWSVPPKSVSNTSCWSSSTESLPTNRRSRSNQRRKVTKLKQKPKAASITTTLSYSSRSQSASKPPTGRARQSTEQKKRSGSSEKQTSNIETCYHSLTSAAPYTALQRTVNSSEPYNLKSRSRSVSTKIKPCFATSDDISLIGRSKQKANTPLTKSVNERSSPLQKQPVLQTESIPLSRASSHEKSPQTRTKKHGCMNTKEELISVSSQQAQVNPNQDEKQFQSLPESVSVDTDTTVKQDNSIFLSTHSLFETNTNEKHKQTAQTAETYQTRVPQEGESTAPNTDESTGTNNSQTDELHQGSDSSNGIATLVVQGNTIPIDISGDSNGLTASPRCRVVHRQTPGFSLHQPRPVQQNVEITSPGSNNDPLCNSTLLSRPEDTALSSGESTLIIPNAPELVDCVARGHSACPCQANQVKEVLGTIQAPHRNDMGINEQRMDDAYRTSLVAYVKRGRAGQRSPSIISPLSMRNTAMVLGPLTSMQVARSSFCPKGPVLHTAIRSNRSLHIRSPTCPEAHRSSEQGHENRDQSVPRPGSSPIQRERLRTRDNSPPPQKHSKKVDQAECEVCSSVAPLVTFRPCGHQAVCVSCCVNMKKCIVCKRPLESKISKDGTDMSAQTSVNEIVLSRLRDLELTLNCPVCMERAKNRVFQCGHATCDKCAFNLRICPICRKTIIQKIKLF